MKTILLFIVGFIFAIIGYFNDIATWFTLFCYVVAATCFIVLALIQIKLEREKGDTNRYE
ncbi:hypothetical protein IMZ31_02235 [Pontibacillus sp. ALD_SL1]|uniref:hypothetical protein n=1 Tax=Pontibacillus sp. ALD_SL1 TaxID=2777185 RepID=UPI001A978C5F|nr:hypothetical protein [Pontibacillus sp. ALD_SL1]QST00436.1 hypothetical protein IMZ31_02235 [Pontibacillus sp. ALD_SL1]